MFFIWTLIPPLYVAARFIWLLPLPKYSRVLISAIIVLICQYHHISQLVWGSVFSPEFPRPVMIFVGWILGATLLFASFLLVRDLIALLFRLLSIMRVSSLLTGMPLCLLALVLAGIGIMQAIRVPDVKTTVVSIPNLPPAFEGFTLVQLTDLHASSLLTRPWVEDVVKKANALNPDLMVLTGDMSDGTVARRYQDVEPLAKLRAKQGVYAITGNHEYYFNYPAWMAVYQKLGIPFLLNQNVRIHRGEQSLVLAGVTDEVAGRRGEPGPDLDKALEGTSASDAIVLLNHRPGSAANSAKHGVALQLSGHTHGGMILIMEEAVKPANNGFISGMYQVDGMSLYVSNGAGLWNGLPIRLGRPSEISQIVLRRGEPAASQ